jgi:hypothetical protein
MELGVGFGLGMAVSLMSYAFLVGGYDLTAVSRTPGLIFSAQRREVIDP